MAAAAARRPGVAAAAGLGKEQERENPRLLIPC
jgi:hypothetical protein